jgi:hypothetical protein
MNSNKCKHGFYTDPNGYHIFPKTENKRDIWKEAERLANKEPVTVAPKQQIKPVNEIRKLSTLLEDAFNY